MDKLLIILIILLAACEKEKISNTTNQTTYNEITVDTINRDTLIILNDKFYLKGKETVIFSTPIYAEQYILIFDKKTNDTMIKRIIAKRWIN